MPSRSGPEPRMVAAPDKLKGSLGAAAAAQAIAAAGIAEGWIVDSCPLSDGGEGFAAVLSCLGGAVRETTVTGPSGEPVTARWRLAGDIAVIESAAASGLVLAGGAAGNDPMTATSRGTGELVVAAVAHGARRVLVGVGGSAMTDGGLGALEAIDDAGGIGDVEVVVACDVSARFVDAAERFGPQKGAGPDDVARLRHRLEDLAVRYEARAGRDVAALAGSGAAGGLAGGLAVLGATLVPGFDLVAGVIGLDDRIAGSALVVSAEGRLDASSWTGKVVGGVSALAARHGVPVLVVVGSVGDDAGSSAAPGPHLTVVDLSERFGTRAMEDPGPCITEAVSAYLRQSGAA